MAAGAEQARLGDARLAGVAHEPGGQAPRIGMCRTPQWAQADADTQAAWSVAAAGVALDDRALFDWAMERATNAVDEIVADGTMPLEMDRKSRALLYHTFAAAPLVMLAETGAVNGRNLYGARFGIIHKFVARTLDGLQDPSWFEQVTGVRQVVAESTTPEKIAWLPVYESRFGTRAGAFANPTTEPLFLRRTGGDMALLFGPVR